MNIDMTKYRMYDYSIGRFLQVDPLADAANQERWTAYHYTFNNPLRYNDPLGKCPPDDPDCIAAQQAGSGQSSLEQRQRQIFKNVSNSIKSQNKTTIEGKITVGPQADVQTNVVNGKVNVAAFELVSFQVESGDGKVLETEGNNIVTGDVKISQGLAIGAGGGNLEVERTQTVGKPSEKKDDFKASIPIVPLVSNVTTVTPINDSTEVVVNESEFAIGGSFIFGAEFKIRHEHLRDTTKVEDKK